MLRLVSFLATSRLRAALFMSLALCASLMTFPVHAFDFQTGKAEIIKASGEVIELEIEFAISLEERQRGLMFRRELGEYNGMLFDYGAEQRVTMWMDNTPLTLDMLFIDGDGIIRRIEAFTEPFSRNIIPSGSPVRYVLEVNGGFSAAKGVSVGDRLEVTTGPAGN